MLIRHLPDKMVNASNRGDNCDRWILKIAKAQDITINLRHIMNFGKRKFQAKILNNGQTVENMEELAEVAT